MSDKVFITGGGGFVGSAVISEVLSRRKDVVGLVNRKAIAEQGGRVASMKGGLFGAPLAEAMAGCIAIIHLVGIIAEKGEANFQKIHVEGTRRMIEAARQAGVRRFVQMSALGTRANAVSQYHRTKFTAEQLVRESGLDWTIFRPSMIHGPGGEFMQWEEAWARGRKAPFFFIPYFGAGLLGFGRKSLIQPVYVNDVARAFVDSLDQPLSIRHTYPLCGPEVMTWPEFHRCCAIAFTGKSKITLPIPAWYAKSLTQLLPANLLPFNRDQVQMSQEDNAADMGHFIADFGWQPRSMEETIGKKINW